jgi:putative transposase
MTAGISGELVRDVMVQTLNTRFGQVEQVPEPAQWLSDNGSGYIARETRTLARDIGLVACRTPYRSPQSNGYRRLWALLRRQRRAQGKSPINAKRVYRIATSQKLLLQRYTGSPPMRVHDGKIAVERSDQRYCSDGFEIACDNGERVRVAFSLDCCDRQAIAFAATTAGISGELVRDVMVQTVSARFGEVEQMPSRAQWLSDNGSGYIARDTRAFAQDIGLIVCRTPYRSPQSNGMAEPFVKTFKGDYVSVNPTPDGPTVLQQLVHWFADYNSVHPHSALRCRSPDEFREENDAK